MSDGLNTKYEPGDVLHLVKQITHHVAPGSGALLTAKLSHLTHVTVRVIGKTVGRCPTPDEIREMQDAPSPHQVDLARVPMGVCGVGDYENGDTPCGQTVFYNLFARGVVCGCCSEGHEPCEVDPDWLVAHLRQLLEPAYLARFQAPPKGGNA